MQGLSGNPAKLFDHTINELLKTAKPSAKEKITKLQQQYHKLIRSLPSELTFFRKEAQLNKKLKTLSQFGPNPTSNQSQNNSSSVNNNFSI